MSVYVLPEKSQGQCRGHAVRASKCTKITIQVFSWLNLLRFWSLSPQIHKKDAVEEKEDRGIRCPTNTTSQIAISWSELSICTIHTLVRQFTGQVEFVQASLSVRRKWVACAQPNLVCGSLPCSRFMDGIQKTAAYVSRVRLHKTPVTSYGYTHV